MHPIEVLVVLAATQVGFLVGIERGGGCIVALPPIGGDPAAGRNVVQQEGFQRVGRAIQGHMQANATHSLLHLSALHGHGDNGFALGPAAALAGALAADDKFIHFHAAGEFPAILADGAAPQLLQPAPGGAVAAQTQQLLEIGGIDAGFAGGEPPHGLEPIGDRLLGAVHDRAGGQGMLVLAPGADV